MPKSAFERNLPHVEMTTVFRLTFRHLKKGIQEFRRNKLLHVAPAVKGACTDPKEGDRGSGRLLENHIAIGYLSNTGPDPLKYLKATKPALNVGP